MGFFLTSDAGEGVMRGREGDLPVLPVRNCVDCQWCAGGCGLEFAEFLCAKPGVAASLIYAGTMVRRCHSFRVRHHA
jgi:hypothetical protein